jgi:transcriptional regulator with XRE-family HTH domain
VAHVDRLQDRAPRGGRLSAPALTFATDTSVATELRNRIAVRQAAGLESPHALAVAAGIDPSAMSRFLGGHRGLSLESVERLAAALGFRVALVDAGRRKSRA